MWDKYNDVPKKKYLYTYTYTFMTHGWRGKGPKSSKIIQHHPTSPMSCWTKPVLKIGISQIRMVGISPKNSPEVCGATTSKPAVLRPLWRRVNPLMPRGQWKQVILGIATFISVPRLASACYGLLWPVYVRNVSWEILGEIGEIYVGCSCWWLARFWSWVLLDICWLLLIRFFAKSKKTLKFEERRSIKIVSL